MSTLSLLRTLAAALSLAAAASHAGVVFQQAAAPTVSSAWTSQFGIGQGGFQALDDFSLESNATIGRVTWRGTYFDTTPGQLVAGAPNTDTWIIEFWAGDASGPRRQLYSQDYRGSDATRTSLGRQTVGDTTFELMDFALNLTQQFDAVAGTQYWFSVMSKSRTFNPLFSWTNAVGEGVTFQRQFAGNGAVVATYVRGGNRAYTLESTEVPEPATLALVATALVAGGLTTRRRRCITSC